MRFKALQVAVAVIAFGTASHCQLQAQDPTPSKPELAIKKAAEQGQLIYVLFYKESNTATKAMAETITSAVKGQEGQSTITYVRLTNDAERAVAEKYQVTRAPMPMVIAVHPNGAVTGYFNTKATEQDLAQCLVSPKKAECMKALQQNQLVLVCLQSSAKQVIPKGVKELSADPHFTKRTRVVTLSLTDPDEAAFLKGMEVDPSKDGAMTVFLAPPGALVGKFPTTATKDQIAAKLAQAGKCCDDENCKHNAAQQTQQPRKVTR